MKTFGISETPGVPTHYFDECLVPFEYSYCLLAELKVS